jgi:hypothetical protein
MAVMVALGLSTACARVGDEAPPPADAPSSATTLATAGSPAPAGTVEVVADAAALGHVHNLGLDGDALLIGSHQGLFRQPTGEAPFLVGEQFDVMGFTIDGARWLASGHPGAGSDAPADLGLRQSTDQGATWQQLSLAGQADFHRLAAGGDIVLGVNAGDGMLWRSVDGGTTWEAAGPGPVDIAVNPNNPELVVGTTPMGPIRSSDAGTTWQPLDGAPQIALLAWAKERLWGVDVDGTVYWSQDDGTTWRSAGQVPGGPTAMAASTTRIAVLTGDTIWESVDQGNTFLPRVTGLPEN